MKRIHKRIMSGVAAAVIAGSIFIPMGIDYVAKGTTSTVTAVASTVEGTYLYGRLTYQIEEDDSITILECADDVTWVKIQGKIEGREIKKIAENAFSRCENLEKVFICDTVTEIGDYAFANTNIDTIIIPASVSVIGEGAFSGCENLKEVYAYGNKGVSLNLGKDIFEGCNEDLVVYCGTGSGLSSYCWTNNINVVQNVEYWDNISELDEFGDGNEGDKPETGSDDEHTRTTYQDYANGYKYIKGCPEGLSGDDLTYTYHWDDDGYYFDRSGIYITRDDYIILCNCVANEYGANYVNGWEMGLVAEVIFNRYNWWGYSSIRSVIVAPNQFEGSGSYSGLDTFSYKVTDHVINSVNTYLSFPEYYDEGYTSFRGDGVWNYFW